jgi:hypothetical protein
MAAKLAMKTVAGSPCFLTKAQPHESTYFSGVGDETDMELLRRRCNFEGCKNARRNKRLLLSKVYILESELLTKKNPCNTMATP